MRPTPITDSVAYDVGGVEHPEGSVTPVAITRVLERQRDEWREIAERLDAKVIAEQKDHNLTVDRLLAVRDELAVERAKVVVLRDAAIQVGEIQSVLCYGKPLYNTALIEAIKATS